MTPDVQGWRSVVLVEGESDRVALIAVARRRDLDLHGVGVVAMGGATNLGDFASRFGASGAGVALAGLCDAAEVGVFARQLRRSGVEVSPSVASLESAGFFVCHADLEDELIRAVGVEAVVEVIETEGELASLRRLQAQPHQRDRDLSQQLHRFMGSRSGRKARYAGLLAGAVDLDRIPPPLDAVLARATG